MTKSNFDIILYGGPGAGKGTQAKLLQDKLSYLHVSMGAKLRALAEGESDLALQIRDIINDGKLVPYAVTTQVAKQVVAEANDKPIIFDGYPRSVEQATDLDEILEESNRKVKFIYLELPMDVALTRITSRAKIEHRVDDMDEDTVRERIEVFNENIKSLLDYYRGSNRLIVVNGDKDVETISQNIFQILENATDQ
jgi:adenylate kinase